jgi:hypothetical protein
MTTYRLPHPDTTITNYDDVTSLTLGSFTDHKLSVDLLDAAISIKAVL